ncbi:MAG: hypothetical protein DRI36_01190 [Caldiserica bacterium]|nr:MAG: hypothetical protein DRI36_01190 [Caldisericota bacterium]
MRRISLVFLIVISLTCRVLGSVGTTSGEIVTIPVGARQVGMGEVGVVNKDGSSIWWNPAGLGYIAENGDIEITHLGMYEGMNADFISGSIPLKGEIKEFGVIGVGLGILDIGEIKKYTSSGYENGEMNLRTKVMKIGYGRKLVGERNELRIGLGIKSIQDDLGEAKGKGMGIDIGWIYKLEGGGWSGGEPVEVGMSLQNLGGKLQYENESYPLPQIIRIGLRWGKDIGICDIDTEIELMKEGTLSAFKAGVEFKIKKIFSLRMGYKSTGNTDISDGLRIGFGVNILNVNLDYAYSGYGELGVVHRISIGIKFGKVLDIEGIKAGGIDPKEAFRRGMKYYEEGKYAEAVLEFNKVLEVEPMNEEAFEMMKKASEKLKEK